MSQHSVSDTIHMFICQVEDKYQVEYQRGCRMRPRVTILQGNGRTWNVTAYDDMGLNGNAVGANLDEVVKRATDLCLRKAKW